MKLLHLTPKRHYNSIMKHGLVPSKVSLPSHLLTFQYDGLAGDKVNYLWNPSNGSCATDKIIKDFIYCKHFIHPRNKMFEFNEKMDLPYIDYRKIGNELFGEAEDYILLEVDGDDIDLIDNSYIHSQTNEDDGEGGSTACFMNSKYEHNDKELFISPSIILPKKIKLINEISTRFNKNQTIDVSYRKV